MQEKNKKILYLFILASFLIMITAIVIFFMVNSDKELSVDNKLTEPLSEAERKEVDATEKELLGQVDDQSIKFEFFLSGFQKENGYVPENGWREFCFNNFDTKEKRDVFVNAYYSIDKNKSHVGDDSSVYESVMIYFKTGKVNCEHINSGQCDKIKRLASLMDYIKDKNDEFCLSYDEKEALLCRILKNTYNNKQLLISDELVNGICSVDEGFFGENILFFNNSGEQKECKSDGGHIFNIVLAVANNSSSYCDITADSHLIHKVFCLVASSNGNEILAEKNFKEYFCNKFADSVDNE